MMRASQTCFHATSAAKGSKPWLKCSDASFVVISYSCSLVGFTLLLSSAIFASHLAALEANSAAKWNSVTWAKTWV